MTTKAMANHSTDWHDGYEAGASKTSALLEHAEEVNGDLLVQRESARVALVDAEAAGMALVRENDRLRNLLAECFPLVRPGTDLNRRLREALGHHKN